MFMSLCSQSLQQIHQLCVERFPKLTTVNGCIMALEVYTSNYLAEHTQFDPRSSHKSLGGKSGRVFGVKIYQTQNIQSDGDTLWKREQLTVAFNCCIIPNRLNVIVNMTPQNHRLITD